MAWVLGGALGVACATRGSVSVDLSSYSRACRVDAECTTVITEKCGDCPPCAGSPIATSEVKRFRRAYEALRCREPTERAACGPCEEAPPIGCVAGTCRYRER